MSISNEGLFNHIPRELVSKILYTVDDFEAFKNCETVCRSWNITVLGIKDYNLKKEEFFLSKLMPNINFFPRTLIDALGGKKNVCQLPRISLSNEDDYGYIDWLEPKDLAGHSICRGIDDYNRPFIAFAVQQYGIFPFGSGKKVRTIHKCIQNPNDSAWVVAGRSFQLDYSKKMETSNKTLSTLRKLISKGYEIDGYRISILG